ncbi:U-box domain-containing protein 35-like [Nymphaea colorata]|uniref:U-box domain-containing protein 35-like n=1 Tax=Nymphaea colorata TaxID=210225 RepID=UPI00129EC335|nr:U-box domain-containing protein 35-like [Nymphaea colorata]XP_031501542.1 U-box domain-containing protein 35-like [Nymphaea colorata]XP_031501543.1 U-box domain-containing protein 35-like [Nymphaea colorata]XP_031501544.1 U-box domain-containing protein 35-like [Nymphaea colorata]
METHENKDEVIPAPSISPSTVTVAISGSKNSKHALTWALEKFIPEGRISFRLLHVHPKITMIPTPMGNSLPISKVREDIVAAYRKEIEWQTNTKLLPFKQMCAKRQVEVEILLIESDDIANAISEDIAKTEVTKLVIGSSSRSIISRHRGLSRRISSSVPNICTVYVISKGKLSSIQSASSVENGVRSSGTTSFNSVSSLGSTTQTEWTGMSPSDEDSQMPSPSMLDQHCQALSNMNRVILNSAVDINHSRNSSLPNIEDIISLSSGYMETRNTAISASIGSFQSETLSWISDQATTSDIQTEKFSASQLDLDLELEKLRIELRHAQKMCSMAEEETADVSQKVTQLSALKMNEASKLEEISCKEEMARESAKCEREKREAAEKEAEFVKECAERELMQRRGAESRASRDVKEKTYIENTLERLDQRYKKISWEEIVSATSCFSDSLRIGGGAYGTVYKCRLHHTTVAVKVLQLNEEYKTKQFHQELEVLSKIRHPHLLLLLGACPDHGCLVYEFMENGSLDDRLFRQGNSSSIPWIDRFRIAWEIGSALHFLHNSKPKPIVHRDLKPANILLDHNLVSKIGDVGLATLLPTNLATGTAYKNTALAGTFCYIDPEYQRTGLVSSKSDLYALGVVILQLLTAKPPMGLAYLVETALLENRFEDLLDVTAGEWPLEETQELAALGLSCAELRRSDRPDLGNAVLPMLERLKGFAETARVSMPKTQNLPPSHFVCPILQDVMQNPCVAADGYTYERRAIEKWLSMNDKSPLTNLPLPNKFLIPNYSLLGAIREWRSKTSGMLNKRS